MTVLIAGGDSFTYGSELSSQGQINKEFMSWNHPSTVREIQQLPSKGGFRIVFYKNKKA